LELGRRRPARPDLLHHAVDVTGGHPPSDRTAVRPASPGTRVALASPALNRRAASSEDGRAAIWHETFLVRAGEYESIYGNMPPTGLGKAGRLLTLAEAKSARERVSAGIGGG
jgi:hypothetical protein